MSASAQAGRLTPATALPPGMSEASFCAFIAALADALLAATAQAARRTRSRQCPTRPRTQSRREEGCGGTAGL